jgi:hypothetical protein
VRAATISLLGKEANRLEEVQHGLVFDSEQAQQVYATLTLEGTDTWDLVVQVLAHIGAREVARRSGVSVSHVGAVLARRARAVNIAPSFHRVAIDHARGVLGESAPEHGDALLAAFLATLADERSCGVCGRPVGGRAIYCGARCRKRCQRNTGRASSRCAARDAHSQFVTKNY